MHIAMPGQSLKDFRHLYVKGFLKGEQDEGIYSVYVTFILQYINCMLTFIIVYNEHCLRNNDFRLMLLSCR